MAEDDVERRKQARALSIKLDAIVEHYDRHGPASRERVAEVLAKHQNGVDALSPAYDEKDEIEGADASR